LVERRSPKPKVGGSIPFWPVFEKPIIKDPPVAGCCRDRRGISSVAFDIYKRGQGKYTRLGTAFVGLVIAGLGCWRLYILLQAVNWPYEPRTALWISTMVPVIIFIALALLVFWLVNKNSVADFMIAAEGEMKKVSWSSRKEIIVSTFIVIVVVIIMALLLGATDLSFEVIFDRLLR
jgi:preprotein translocase subunit SecE